MKLLPIPFALRKRPLLVRAEVRNRTSTHISQALRLLELAPVLRSADLRWLPGFHRASPSTPLDAVVMCAATITRLARRLRRSSQAWRTLCPGRPDERADERDEHRCRAFPSPGCAASAAAISSRRAEPRERQPAGRDDPGLGPALGQHRAPDAARDRLDRGAVRVPRPRPRGRALAQPAAEDRRVPRLPVHRPALPGLRPPGQAAERRRARHLRRPGLPGHDPEHAAEAGRVPVRALPPEGGAARAAVLARARAICSTGSSTTASTTASRCCARSATSSTRSRTRSSRGAPRTSSATSPTPSRRSSTSAR